MKPKEKFELIFICVLILLAGGLLYIYFADLGDDSYLPNIIKNPFAKTKYEIIDKIEVCEDGYEELYKDDTYIYYFDCNKKNLIYLEWEDGTITPLMDELNSGNVKIDSLMKNGLKCNKKLINEENETEENQTIEENTTIEVEDAQENKTDEN